MLMTIEQRLEAIRALAEASERLSRSTDPVRSFHEASRIIAPLQAAMDAIGITRLSVHESAVKAAKRVVGGEA